VRERERIGGIGDRGEHARAAAVGAGSSMKLPARA
jgi:hypothetical protein